MKQNKHCKGCMTYIEHLNECGVGSATKINRFGKCPCSKCLIKVMCKYGCEKYDEFSAKAGKKLKNT